MQHIWYVICNKHTKYIIKMDKKRISVAFVGVYEQNLSFIPAFSPDFCKNLFHQPATTVFGITPDGFVITIEKRQMPLVVVAQNKISVRTQEEDTLTQILKSVVEELKKSGVSLKCSAFGLNYEDQWLQMQEPAEIWMQKRFIKRDLLKTAKLQSCQQISFRAEINATELVNLTIEPRAGVNDGLYANVNHHHILQSEDIPQPEKLKELFVRSITQTENILSELIRE